MTKEQQTAIVKRDQAIARATEGALHDTKKLRALFEEAREVAIVLAPSLHIPALPPKTAVVVTPVFMDIREGVAKDRDGNVKGKTYEGDVYQDRSFCGADEVALNKSGLLKLMAAGGLQEDPACPTKLETLHEYHWRARVVLVGRGLVGLPQRVSVTKELDLRDGAPDAVKPEWKGREKTGRTIPLDATALANARRHGPAKAQTCAMLAAFRKFPGLGVRQKYTLAELQKPFFVPCLVPDLDMSDPEDRAAARALAIGATAALYGAARPALPSGPAGQVIETEATLAPGEEPTDPDEPTENSTQAPEPGTDEDLPPDPPPPARHVCGCVCGDQTEIDASFAAKTLAWGGIELCRECVPGRAFNAQRHRTLGRSLNFPNRPALNDVEAACAYAEAARKASEARS